MYHVSKPIPLMETISACNTDLLVIDTTLSRAPGSYFQIHHEKTDEPLAAFDYELVTYPTKKAILDIAGQFGYSTVILKPRFTSYIGCGNYRTGFRRAFLCAKRTALDDAELDGEKLGVITQVKDVTAWAYSEGNRALRQRVRRRRGTYPVPPGRYAWAPRARLGRNWARVSRRLKRSSPFGRDRPKGR
jgi:hypothetical protein